MKNRLLLLSTVLILVALPVFSGSIQGRVMADESDEPLLGADIVISCLETGAATDARGEFRIDGLPEGRHTVRIAYMGYKTVEKVILLKKNESFHHEFKLQESVINTDVVVITATRTAKSLKNVPALTQVVSRQQLEATGAVSAQEVLNELPALDFAPDRHGANITMQGLGPKYVLFLVDGERMAGEVKGNIDFSRINTTDIERIEIVKGASSCLYGSNAIAGVVNVITQRTTQPFQFDLYSRFSAYQELSLGGSVGFKIGWLASKTNVIRKQSDGYDLNPEDINRTVEKYHDISIMQKLTLTPVDRLVIRSTVSSYMQDRLEARRVVRNKYPRYSDFNFNLNARYEVNQRMIVETSYHSDNYDTKDVLERLNDEERNTYEHHSQTRRLMGHYCLNLNHTLTGGLELDAERVFSTRITGENHKAHDWILFFQDDMTLGHPWKGVAGFRTNRHSEYGAHWTPTASLMYQALPINLRATYARGFKSPTLKELYMNWDHGGGGPYVFGNPDLQPETSDYVSFSAEYIDESVNASLSLFRTELENMIDSRPLPGDPNVNYYGNINQAMTQGMEMLIKGDLGFDVVLSGGYSFVDSKDESTSRPLLGRARHTGTIQLEYHNHKSRMNANIRGKFVGTKIWEETINPETQDLDQIRQKAHVIWRLTAMKTIMNTWKLTGGIENIFDYQDPDYLITPGRVFYGGFQFLYNK